MIKLLSKLEKMQWFQEMDSSQKHDYMMTFLICRYVSWLVAFLFVIMGSCVVFK